MNHYNTDSHYGDIADSNYCKKINDIKIGKNPKGGTGFLMKKRGKRR
jgi:hypothetical protein